MPSAIFGERVKQRTRGHRPACLLPFEVRRLFHCRAGNPHACRQNGADEKRDPPSPRVQTCGAHRTHGQQADSDREEPADLAGRGGHRRDQAAPSARRALQQIGDDRVVLASDRKPHHAAEGKKKPAGRRARLRMSRQRGGAEHGQRHERDGEQHRSPPPEPIPDMAKEQCRRAGATDRRLRMRPESCSARSRRRRKRPARAPWRGKGRG